MQIVTIEVPHLGNRCHLVYDGTSALVVDPPRDVRAVEAAAAEHGVDIVAVADTHVHNDYVSGALALARRHGADYLLSADEPVRFERVGVRGGDRVAVGALEIEVVDTPGHTRHHQAFVAHHAGHPSALLSGGSLLHGTVGRTDLIDPHLTRTLTRAQWAGARRLIGLDAATLLLPTHGFGSFCASTTVAPTDTDPGAGPVTVGHQRPHHPALTLPEETFVNQLVEGFGPVPRHYAEMAPLNRAGAGRAPARPATPVTSEQVADAVLGGAWVVDLRGRAAYARGHLPGTLNVEYSPQFATYVGWLVPWEDDIVLLTDTPAVLESAIRDLADIGIDGVDLHVLEPTEHLTGSYRVSDWAGFRDTGGSDHAARRVVVDVRQRDEYDAGHLRGAVHVPVQDVAGAAPTLPAGELWVHCRSGYRAGIAASLLHRMGRSVVQVDDAWERVDELAIPVEHAA